MAGEGYEALWVGVFIMVCLRSISSSKDIGSGVVSHVPLNPALTSHPRPGFNDSSERATEMYELANQVPFKGFFFLHVISHFSEDNRF